MQYILIRASNMCLSPDTYAIDPGTEKEALNDLRDLYLQSSTFWLLDSETMTCKEIK